MFAKKQFWIVLALALCGTLIANATASAIEVERLQGTIVMASEGQVAFNDMAGNQRLMTTTPDCPVTIDGRSMRLEDLKNGMPAMLLINRNGQCMAVDARSVFVPVGLY